VRTFPRNESNRWRRPMSSAASTKVARNDRAAANLPALLPCSKGRRPFFVRPDQCSTSLPTGSREGQQVVRSEESCVLPAASVSRSETERVMLPID